MNYDRGYRYFKSAFPLNLNSKITFEATPDYLDHPLAPKLCHMHLPKVKLIVILREPVSRAYSHFNYVQSYNSDEKKIPFEEALNKENNRMQIASDLLLHDRYNSARYFSNYGYVRKGLYFEQISNWLKYYPLSNFHFIFFEDFITDPKKELNRVFEFLNLAHETISTDKIHNKTKYTENRINSKTKEKLKALYSSHNKKLFDLLQIENKWKY